MWGGFTHIKNVGALLRVFFMSLFFPPISRVCKLDALPKERLSKAHSSSDPLGSDVFLGAHHASLRLGQKSCRTKVSRIFRIFVPNFAPNFAPNFPRIFRGLFVLRLVGDGDQKQFTKNPRHFSMQNSQANTKKYSQNSSGEQAKKFSRNSSARQLKLNEMADGYKRSW